jgi:hypothetical protein
LNCAIVNYIYILSGSNRSNISIGHLAGFNIVLRVFSNKISVNNSAQTATLDITGTACISEGTTFSSGITCSTVNTSGTINTNNILNIQGITGDMAYIGLSETSGNSAVINYDVISPGSSGNYLGLGVFGWW